MSGCHDDDDGVSGASDGNDSDSWYFFATSKPHANDDDDDESFATSGGDDDYDDDDDESFETDGGDNDLGRGDSYGSGAGGGDDNQSGDDNFDDDESGGDNVSVSVGCIDCHTIFTEPNLRGKNCLFCKKGKLVLSREEVMQHVMAISLKKDDPATCTVCGKIGPAGFQCRECRSMDAWFKNDIDTWVSGDEDEMTTVMMMKDDDVDDDDDGERVAVLFELGCNNCTATSFGEDHYGTLCFRCDGNGRNVRPVQEQSSEGHDPERKYGICSACGKLGWLAAVCFYCPEGSGAVCSVEISEEGVRELEKNMPAIRAKIPIPDDE